MGRSSRTWVRTVAAGAAFVAVAALSTVVGTSPATAATGDITTYVDPMDRVINPAAIVLGPDGNLWFVSRDSDRIGRLDPDTGVITTYADPSGNVDTPLGITAGPDGNLWFTSADTDRVGRIDPDTGTINTFADGDDELDQPGGITAGPDGNLWFTNASNNRIGRIDPDTFEITTYLDDEANIQFPTSIAAGPDGNLWYVGGASSGVGRIDPGDGTITLFPADPGSVSQPGTITAGPDGNLWFTSSATHRIGRIDPDDGSISTFVDPEEEVSFPYGITTGPDGNLWFTNIGNDRIGRIDPDDGSITTYADPAGKVSQPTFITPGPAGDLWFSSTANRSIGSVEVVAAPTFTDVGLSHPFYADVEWMASQGISQGYLPGPTYRPSAAVTRLAMSAFLYRLAGEPAFSAPATPSFSDVGLSHPFYDEIEWMAATGISTGYPGGTYRPDDAVTRQAMSAFLYRVAGEPELSVPDMATFTDVGLSHPFFAEVEWMAGMEISEGYLPGPTYKPAAAVTRQAMSAFMHRLADGPGVDV